MSDSSINFFFEETEEPELDYQKIKHWLLLLIKSYGFNLREINYIVCSDNYLLAVNKEYLNHDYFTDIITFDNSEIDNEIESDIFVSMERIIDNSINLQTDQLEETLRVLAHGVLHLCGFKDKTPENAKEMRFEENKAIELYHRT